MTMPNFFIVGAQKAGTTSLYQYLNQHPQVYMSPARNHISSRACLGIPQAGPQERPVRDLAEYQRPFCGRLRRESDRRGFSLVSV